MTTNSQLGLKVLSIKLWAIVAFVKIRWKENPINFARSVENSNEPWSYQGIKFIVWPFIFLVSLFPEEKLVIFFIHYKLTLEVVKSQCQWLLQPISKGQCSRDFMLLSQKSNGTIAKWRKFCHTRENDAWSENKEGGCAWILLSQLTTDKAS